MLSKYCLSYIIFRKTEKLRKSGVYKQKIDVNKLDLEWSTSEDSDEGLFTDSSPPKAKNPILQQVM